MRLLSLASYGCAEDSSTLLTMWILIQTSQQQANTSFLPVSGFWVPTPCAVLLPTVQCLGYVPRNGARLLRTKIVEPIPNQLPTLVYICRRNLPGLSSSPTLPQPVSTSSFKSISMPTLNIVEMNGPELTKKQSRTSEASTLDILVDWIPGTRNEDEETKATSQVDDYPDGGLAAWCIVLGVGPSVTSSEFC